MHDWLSDRIKEFPRNTIFLSLLAWSDSKLRVVDETRRLLYDTVLVSPQDCVSSRIFAIEHEMARGNANTTKAAFEHAVASDTCKGSAAVWTWYLRFCCAQEGSLLQPKVTKDVFYRALRHCPWSKDVILVAFRSLSREMGSAELMGVYNTITSKGLRVHVGLDEFLERRRAEKQNMDMEEQKKRR
jgi:hypothetical protein